MKVSAAVVAPLLAGALAAVLWPHASRVAAQAPPSPPIAVKIDVRPGSCPNLLALQSPGRLPVALLGSSTFDVSRVDPTTIRLHVVDGAGTLGALLAGTASIGSVAPVTASNQVTLLSQPAVEDILNNCSATATGGNALVVQFSIPTLVQALNLAGLRNGATVPLGVTGRLIGGRDFSSVDSPDYATIRLTGAPSITAVVAGTGTSTTAPNDFVITAPARINLTATTSGSGVPAFYWFHRGGLVTGVGEVFFSSSTSASTTASFNTAGEYLIGVSASAGSGAAQQMVRVTVNPNPNGVFDHQAVATLLSRTDPRNNPGALLSFGFFTSNVTDAPTADAYYKAIDPTDKKLFFGDWLAQNGINPADPTTYTLAAYFNAIDLGFGRRMIASRDGTAWVVTNHRTVEDAVDDVNPIAAVAMEYRPDASTGATFTKFYIYDRQHLRVNPATGRLDAPRVTGADLDGGGVKFLPGLCITCHGGQNPPNVGAGQPYPIPGGNVYAHFLPFDLNALQYSERQQFSRRAQETAFRNFNQQVLNIEVQNADPSNNGSPMATLIELIEGWYGQPFNLAGATLAGTQRTGFVPRPWLASPKVGGTIPAQFYAHVIAHDCRNCHSTRTELGGLNFGRLIDSQTGAPVPALAPATIGPPVFGSHSPFTELLPSHITSLSDPFPAMPHTHRTLERFWLNTSANPLANPPEPPEPELFRRYVCDYGNLPAGCEPLVTVTPSAVRLVVGRSAQLVATVTDSGTVLAGRAINWSASGTAATITTTGLVGAQSVGGNAVTATDVASGMTGRAQVFVSADQFFYSAFSADIAQFLQNPGVWRDDGLVFGFSSTQNDLTGNPDPGIVPLWRFYDPVTGTHFWTTDPTGELFPAGFPAATREGSAGYVFTSLYPGTVPVYRFFSSQGVHFWSTDPNGEGKAGFAYEGIAFYAFPASSADPRALAVRRISCGDCGF